VPWPAAIFLLNQEMSVVLCKQTRETETFCVRSSYR